MSGRSQGVRLRRTWPQRVLIIFNVGCIVAALAAAGALAYAKRTTSQIDRVSLSQLVDAESLSSTDPRNFLIVGNDSDEGLDDGDAAKSGRSEVEGVRSDTMMIVRVDPEEDEVRILSLPRDLWVDIPGHDPSRINSTLQLGGPDLLIATIKSVFGIDINHYVEVDFAGFQDLVGALDGVPIWFDAPVRDSNSGLNVQTSGCTTLNADGALSYVRSRHYQIQEPDGDWRPDPSSDLGRIQRQQDFIRRLLRRAIEKGGRDPRKLAEFINIGAKSLALDDKTTVNDLLALGDALRTFDPEMLKTYNLPVTDKLVGTAEVLDLQNAVAEPTLALFRGTGEPEAAGEILPSMVEARVSNGTGVTNQGTDTSNKLAVIGFQMGVVAQDTSVPRTEVRYPQGMQAEAVEVARHLAAEPLLVPTDDLEEAAVTVVTGPDFVDVLAEKRPATEIEAPATTTTTTTAPTTTTTSASADDDEDDTTTSIIDEDGVTVTEPSDFVPQGAPSGIDCG